MCASCFLKYTGKRQYLRWNRPTSAEYLYVMETYHPECLFIATSCVAGVIGDDAESESADAEMRYGIPVICIPYAGFLGGEYSEGYYKTAETIIERFLDPVSTYLIGFCS